MESWVFQASMEHSWRLIDEVDGTLQYSISLRMLSMNVRDLTRRTDAFPGAFGGGDHAYMYKYVYVYMHTNI